MKTFAAIVFCIMPVIGLLLSIRIWLLLRNGLRVTAKIVGYKEERWNGDIDADNSRFLPIVAFQDETNRSCRLTLSQERPMKWKGVKEDEIKLIYRRGEPQHAKIAYWGYLWLAPIFLFGPAVILLIALGWLILASKLHG